MTSQKREVGVGLGLGQGRTGGVGRSGYVGTLIRNVGQNNGRNCSRCI